MSTKMWVECIVRTDMPDNIVPWNYGELLKVFASNQSPPTQTYRVNKKEELGKLLDTGKIRQGMPSAGGSGCAQG